ncbi:MAG TPA: DMT family transporter [Pelolinea sp.]|nr:DMT family transporter [Pelolinea sp.]
MSIKYHTKKNTNQINPVYGLFLAIAAVSTASIFIRFAQTAYPSLIIAAFRLGFSSIILFPFFITGKWRDIQKLNQKEILLLIFSGIFLAAHFASWIKSLELTNVLSSVVLVTTTPIWVSLFSYYFLKERLGRTFYTGLIISLIGVIIISAGSKCLFQDLSIDCDLPGFEILFGEAFSGNILALLGAICAAGYFLCGKELRPKMTNITYVFFVYSIASILLFIIVLFSGASNLELLRAEIIWLLLLALIPQLIGHSLVNWALGLLPASYVSLSLLGEPVGSAILAFLILGETPAVLQIVGSILIVFGIFSATYSRKKMS